MSRFATQAAKQTITQPKEVTLAAGRNSFTLSLTVPRRAAYAGCEFALQLGEGVQVRSVDYQMQSGVKPQQTTPPTEARGLLWFSYFSGANDYEDAVVVVLTCAYTAPEGKPANTSVVLDRATFYTATKAAQGAAPSLKTERVDLRQTTTIAVAGATGKAPVLATPTENITPPAATSPTGVTSSSGASGKQSGSAAAGTAQTTSDAQAEAETLQTGDDQNASAGATPLSAAAADLSIALGKYQKANGDAGYTVRADVNRDGVINTADYVLVCLYMRVK